MVPTTTTLTYANLNLGYTPEASPTDGQASQAQINSWIADGDDQVEIDTGTTTESDKRNLLVKEYAMARWKEYSANRGAAGGPAMNIGGSTVQFAPNPWSRYDKLVENFNTAPNTHLTFETGALDYSNVEW